MRKAEAHTSWSHGQASGGPLWDRRSTCERVQGPPRSDTPRFAGARSVMAPYSLPGAPPVPKRTLKTQRGVECPTGGPKEAPQPDTNAPQRVSTALSTVNAWSKISRRAPSQEAAVAARAPSAAMETTTSQAVGGTVDRPFGTLSKALPPPVRGCSATSLVPRSPDLPGTRKTMRNQGCTALGVRLGAQPRTPSNCPPTAAGPAPSIGWLFRQFPRPQPESPFPGYGLSLDLSPARQGVDSGCVAFLALLAKSSIGAAP